MSTYFDLNTVLGLEMRHSNLLKPFLILTDVYAYKIVSVVDLYKS